MTKWSRVWNWKKGIAAMVVAGAVGQAFAQDALPTTREPADIAVTQPAEVAATAPVIEEKAAAALQRLSEFNKSAKSLRFNLSAAMSVEAEGMSNRTSASFDVAVERPDKLAIIRTKGIGGTVISDGKQVTMFIPMAANYVVQPQAMTIDEVLSGPAATTVQSFPGAAIMISALLASDPFAEMKEHSEMITFVGVEGDGAQQQQHLRVKLEGGQGSFDIYISGGEKPTVTRIVPDLAPIIEQMKMQAPGLGEVKVQSSMEFSNWKINEGVTEDLFKFTPPAGAKKIELPGGPPDMHDVPGNAPPNEGAAPQGKRNPLLGTEAPEFELATYDGKTMKLADHKGKQVVILDFWATWCAPCLEAMPIIQEIADNYKEKGVVFYAVNIEDEASAVKEFLEEKKLKVNVPLDPEGKVLNMYELVGVPHTVIIGKDGTVQAVHRGFEKVKETLVAELDKLVAGQHLVEPVKVIDPNADKRDM